MSRWVDLDEQIYIGNDGEYERYNIDIDTIKAMPCEWIPVSERLPETGDSILVTYSDGEVGIVWSARPKAWGRYIESNNLIYPIAWMPLPKPYREYGDKHE